jgi:hypothetical protein
LPAFTIQVSASNRAPTIAGNPALSVVAGQSYSFTPTAADADGNGLTFSIQNKPAWASFNTATGALTGSLTAAQVGSYSGIAISVTDGTSSASLPAFAIAVTQNASGSATLSWLAPTQNTDGSALLDLAGYRIYYGTSAASLTQIVNVPTVGITTYQVTNLNTGTWYFAVRAYNAAGVESVLSSVVGKNIS